MIRNEAYSDLTSWKKNFFRFQSHRIPGFRQACSQCYKTFHNKLERLSPCLQVRSRAYPRVEHLKGASLGPAMALPTTIRLGWKGLAGTNALAYYENR